MTKQQQCGSATAADCATLLRSLAVLRCYDGGLVDGLLGRLVQLVGDGGAVEVRDLVDSVWAVAVMGPEALRSHCGAVRQLLRMVVGRWELGVGNQGQLRQLWQVQLELDGLVDLDDRGRIGNSSSSRSSGGAGQMRRIQPPDRLRATEHAAGDGPGGVYGASRQLQCLQEDMCSVLQGMVQLGGEQLEGQGTPGRQRAGRRKKALVSQTASGTAAGQDSVAGGVAVRPVPSCTIVSVTREAVVPELRCTADAVVVLGDGRRVAVEVEGPGRLLTNHPHTETRTYRACGAASAAAGAGAGVGQRGGCVLLGVGGAGGGDRGRQEALLAARLGEGLGAGCDGSGEARVGSQGTGSRGSRRAGAFRQRLRSSSVRRDQEEKVAQGSGWRSGEAGRGGGRSEEEAQGPQQPEEIGWSAASYGAGSHDVGFGTSKVSMHRGEM